MENQPILTPDPLFDEFGDYRNIHVIAQVVTSDPIVENAVLTDVPSLLQLYSQEIKPREINFEHYQPKLAWLPLDIVKKTFEATAHFDQTSMRTYLKKNTSPHFLPVMSVEEMSLWQQTLSTLTCLP